MCPGPTFDRVYTVLKGRLVAGEFAIGEHLEPAQLGEELFSSATPVRDVLHRLVGERLVEAPRNDGFRVPAPSEAELRGLYGWRNLLVGLALKPPPALPGSLSPASCETKNPSTMSAVTAEDLFLSIARRSPHLELEAAIASVSERLGMFGPAERRLLGDLADETDLIQRSLVEQDWPVVRRAVAAFHHRRRRQVPALLETAWRIAHNRQIRPV
ncbi:MAG TPA: GntR family transcriptional regulator [Sphingomicrobium sp.]|nr:GntR family transcriptional regulator [Sphingomicrobium sp.]